MGESSGWDGVGAGLVVRMSFLVFRLLFLFFFFLTTLVVSARCFAKSPLSPTLFCWKYTHQL